MPKDDQVSKIEGLVLTIQPEPDFSWICSFRWVVDNVELIIYMKFRKLLMNECRDMDKKHKKYYKNGGLSTTFVPLWCPILVQKIRKTNKRSLRYLKTDHRPKTDGQGLLTRTPRENLGSKM